MGVLSALGRRARSALGNRQSAAAILAGGGLGSVAMMDANDAMAQERASELESARAELEELERASERVRSVDASNPGAVQDLQEFLQSNGFYNRDSQGRGVRPDGAWGDGTSRAQSEYLAQNRGDQERVRARLRELEVAENERAARVSPAVQGLREFAPTAVGLAAVLAGKGFRGRAVRHADEALSRRITDINSLVGSRAPTMAWSNAGISERARRAGNINEFWRQGGAPSGSEPFVLRQGATGPGFAANKRGVTPVGDLYPEPQPGPVGWLGNQVRAQDMAVTGVAAAEAGASTIALEHATAELRRAEEAAQANPTEANLRRVEDARTMVAILQTTQRAGAGFALGRMGGALMHPYARMRPNVAGAEAEMMMLSRALTRPRAPRPKGLLSAVTDRARRGGMNIGGG